MIVQGRVLAVGCISGLLGLALGCSLRTLPDQGFGSAADQATGSSASSVTGPTTTHDDADSGPTTSHEGEGESEGSEDGGPADNSAEGESGSEDSESSADEAPTEEGEAGDTWGIPPDVTNEPCEPLTQDCFPTHKCVPYATEPGGSFLDANKCVPILGESSWGQPCTLSDFNEAQDDCDGEGFCWNLELVGGELQGQCVPFCTGSPQDLMCPLGWGCLFSGAIALCPRRCDPLAQDCPLEYGCYWNGGGFDCELAGINNGDLGPCQDANACEPGYACLDSALLPSCAEESCCSPYCALNQPDTCAAPRSCVAMFDDPPWGLEEVGLCIVG